MLALARRSGACSICSTITKRISSNGVLNSQSSKQQSRQFASSNSTSSWLKNTGHSQQQDHEWMTALVGRLAVAYGIVHFINEYGFELTLCEGPSMLPTIRSSGEIILVDRLTPRLYGMQGGNNGVERARGARKRQESDAENGHMWHQPMIPVNQLPRLTWSTFLGTQWLTPISVGDLVVVQHPDRPGTVCKRVLGLPGDVVVSPPPGAMRRRRGKKKRQQSLYIIPNGHLWMEGDNAANSADSRNYGAIPAALIVGRVVCRVWPLRGSALFGRGGRPVCGGRCTTILPAGYEGEEIVKTL